MRSARENVELTLDRIDDVDPLVNAICTVNLEATAVADALDTESASGRRRGPLHGRVVAIKDNIDTADLLTTAGSIALTERPPDADAPVVARLRAAGMIVIGKSNLSEWANIRDRHSTSGWSAYGGLTRNPYALNRSAGGSSSGSGAAVGAGIVRFAVGTETNGSIICPAAFNGCVGVKPTVGLTPTSGVVPISASQDTVGPMTATVAESAALLSIMAGGDVDYASHAVPGRLEGKRVGVPRGRLWGYDAGADEAAERALGLLAKAGAEIIDNLELAVPEPEGDGPDDELVVLLSELRAGLAAYLPTRGIADLRTLEDVIAFNRSHADEELAYFGQSFFEQALEMPAIDSPEYAAARANCLRIGRDDGIDKLLREHALDALMTPSFGAASAIDLLVPHEPSDGCTDFAAVAGYPLISVPSGLTHGMPVGVCFWGGARSEATLFEIAAGYEAARDSADGDWPDATFPSFI